MSSCFVCLFVFLFVCCCCFTSSSRIFRSYGNVSITCEAIRAASTSLSCHTCCDIRPHCSLIQMTPHPTPTKSPFTTFKGLLRTYSNRILMGFNYYCKRRMFSSFSMEKIPIWLVGTMKFLTLKRIYWFLGLISKTVGPPFDWSKKLHNSWY